MNFDNVIYVDIDPATQKVWAAQGYELAECTNQTSSEFAYDLPHYAKVRIVAHTRNNQLITEVFNRVTGEGTIELATPRFLTKEAVGNAELTLMRARELLRAPSLGGFHHLTHTELPAYSGEDDDNHLIWRYLDFITTLDREAVMRVVRHIRDPRWFVDIRHPERLNAVRGWMGLQPLTTKIMLQGVDSVPKVRRARDIYDCWRYSKESFIYEQAMAKRPEEHAIVLRGSTVFMNFLIRTWQQAIADTGPQQLQLFMPEALMPPGTAEKFNQWLVRQS